MTMLNRRTFLKSTAQGMLVLPSGLRWFGLPGERGADRPPMLVVVQLTGGLDGLSVVVPTEQDEYQRARPLLALPTRQTLPLRDGWGFASSLGQWHREFEAGRLSIVPAVGMPVPDRSHFESLARWHAGDAHPEPGAVGWLARALPTSPAGANFPSLALGSRSLVEAFRGHPVSVLASADLSSLTVDETIRKRLLDPDLVRLDASAGTPQDQSQAKAARDILERLDRVLRSDSRWARDLPDTPLGRPLRDVLRLLEQGLVPPAVFVQTGGFDTHARQDAVLPPLLQGLDSALGAFFAALHAADWHRSVLVLIYSEFGRRVRENGTRGTDHGSAGPAFFWGARTPGGFLPPHPSLTDLDEGDLRPTQDFRHLLSTATHHLHLAPSLFPSHAPLF